MKSLDQIARTMYAAYCKSLGVDAARGCKLAPWNELGSQTQAAWVTAARAAADEVKHLH